MQSVPHPRHVRSGPLCRLLPPSVLGTDRAMRPLSTTMRACLHACAHAWDAGGSLTRVPPRSHALLEAWGQPRTYLLIADHDEYFVLPTPTATLADALTKCTDDKSQARPGLRCRHEVAHTCGSIRHDRRYVFHYLKSLTFVDISPALGFLRKAG